MMKIKMALATVAACALAATAASALVTFDPETGSGFVGKGDVQVPFVWNNATLQANAPAVTFSYSSDTSYDIDCYWETVTGGPNSQTIPHAVTVHKSQSVAGSVDGDPRQTKGQKQFTGFNLLGFVGAPVVTGSVPQVGDSCPQAHATAVVTAVTPSADNAPGELSATYGAESHVIWTAL